MNKLSPLAQPSRFALFQLAHLLESQRDDPSIPSERVRFRCHFGLGFPSADVATVALQGDDNIRRYDLMVTCGGLGGTSSPLPSHYTEAWAADEQASARAGAFLDAYHDRVFQLLYRSWAQLRHLLGGEPGRSDTLSSALLAALGRHGDAHSPASTWLKEAPGRLRSTRSAGVAKMLLENVLNAPVLIIPNIVRPVPLSVQHRFCLGARPQRLARAVRLGRHVMDARGKVRIVVRCAGLEVLEEMTADGGLRPEIGQAIEEVLSCPLSYELCFQFDAVDASRLDGKRRLGLGSHIGPSVPPSVSCVVKGVWS